MTQPPLSKRISDLEEEIGTPLFIREPRGVRLTRNGERLLPHAQRAFDAFQTMERMVRTLVPTTTHRIRIALPPESTRELIFDLLKQLAMHGLEAEFFELSTREQLTKLAENEVDLGLPRYPFDRSGLQILEPLAQPLGVLMSATHPLAAQASIKLHDLKPYPVVMFPRELSPGLHDELLATCRSSGYEPKRIFYGLMMTKMHLKNDLAIAFLTERKSKKKSISMRSEFVWRPLDDAPLYWWTSVVYRANDKGKVLRKVAQIVDSCLQRSEAWMRHPRPQHATD